MAWSTWVYLAFTSVVVGGAAWLTMTGAWLPTANEDSAVSLRDVDNRRTHFATYYAFGK